MAQPSVQAELDLCVLQQIERKREEVLREYMMDTQHIISFQGEYVLIHIIYSLHFL